MGWINGTIRRDFWMAVCWFALTLVTSIGCGYCAGLARLTRTNASYWIAAAALCVATIWTVIQGQRAVKRIVADRAEVGVRTNSAVNRPLGAAFTIAGNGSIVGMSALALARNRYGLYSFILAVGLFTIAVTIFGSLRVLSEMCRWRVMERSGLLFTETKD